MNNFKARNQSLKTLYQPKKQQLVQNNPQQTKTKTTRFLPIINENRDTQKRHAKQLGFSIIKFQNLIASNKNDQNQQDILRSMFYIIKNFGQVDNNFKKLFIDIHIRLREFLFINDTQICGNYKMQEGISYKKAVKHINKYHIQYEQKKHQQLQAIKQRNKQIQNNFKKELNTKEQQITNLKNQVQKYKKMANVEYVRSLERKINSLKETISIQQQDYRALVKKNQLLSEDIQGLRRDLYEQQIKCADHQATIYDLKVSKQKSQIYLLSIKDRFQELGQKMKSLKDVIAKVQNQNEILISQRATLVNRAAVSFDELTPRPLYKHFYPMQAGTKLISTKQIVNKLFQQFIPNKTETFQKYFISKKNKKLVQGQAIRGKVLQQIVKAQRQLQNIIMK